MAANCGDTRRFGSAARFTSVLKVGETRSAGPPRAHRSQNTAPAFSTHESTLTYAPFFRLPLA